MAFLKEDGSLDIERINKLPYEEYMDEIGRLTDEQFAEYLSKIPESQSHEPMRAVKVDYTMEDEYARGAVNAREFINNLLDEYGVK